MKNEKELSEVKHAFEVALKQFSESINRAFDPIGKAFESMSDKTTQFEKGKWYKNTLNSKMWFIESVYIDGVRSFGFDSNGNWCNSEERQPTLSEYILATPSEVQEALTKQATKLGIVEGANVERSPELLKSAGYSHDLYKAHVTKGVFKYEPDTDGLYASDGTLLYCKGLFAKVVTPKEEPIMIGGYAVVFWKEGITVNGHSYTKDTLETIQKVLELPQIYSLNVGCNGQYKFTKELLNQILSRF